MGGSFNPQIPVPILSLGLRTIAAHKNAFEGTVNQVFRSTPWVNFDGAMERNRKH